MTTDEASTYAFKPQLVGHRPRGGVLVSIDPTGTPGEVHLQIADVGVAALTPAEAVSLLRTAAERIAASELGEHT